MNLARRAALASVACAVLLGTLKAWAAWRTGSVAVLASLADSVLDLVASLVTLAGVHWASQPADHDHRFGHGKAEALAALFQVGVIAVSAFAILLRASQRLMERQTNIEAEYGIAVSLDRDRRDAGADALPARGGPPHRLDRDRGRSDPL